MKECPPDAIHRNPNGEVFVDCTCIGCSNCERKCPCGVIQMAAVDPERRSPSLLAWLLLGVTDEPGPLLRLTPLARREKRFKLQNN